MICPGSPHYNALSSLLTARLPRVKSHPFMITGSHNYGCTSTWVYEILPVLYWNWLALQYTVPNSMASNVLLHPLQDSVNVKSGKADLLFCLSKFLQLCALGFDAIHTLHQLPVFCSLRCGLQLQCLHLLCLPTNLLRFWVHFFLKNQNLCLLCLHFQSSSFQLFLMGWQLGIETANCCL